MSRAKASSRECIDTYFDRLEAVLKETGLAEYPSLYFNMDETGFAYDPKPSKIVHLCGEKMFSPFQVGQNHKSLLLPV